MKYKNKFLACLMSVVVAFSFVQIGFAANNGVGEEYVGIDIDAWSRPEVITVAGEKTASFSDITDSKMRIAAELLDAIDIMSGYEDGTFLPDKPLLKGEAAMIIADMMNMNAQTSGGSARSYYDVSPDDTEYQAISMLTATGILTGNPDNTVGIKDELIWQDAIVIMSRALGYEQYAGYNGGYPVGYLQAARTAGLSFGSQKMDSAITRGEFAVLVYNTMLQYPLVTIEFYSSDVKLRKSDETMFEMYHDLYKDKGMVTATEVSAVNGERLELGKIKVGDELYYLNETGFNTYLGYLTEFFYTDESDVKTIVYMYKDSNVKELTIDSENFLEYVDEEVRYSDNNDKIRSAKIDLSGYVFLNGIAIAPRRLEDVMDLGDGMITLVSNDGNSAYENIFISKYENIVLSAISSDGSNVIITPQYDLQDVKIPIDGETVLEFVGLDGQIIPHIVTIEGAFDSQGNPMTTTSFSGIPSGSVLSVFSDAYTEQRGYRLPSADATYTRIVVSDSRVEGKAEEINLSDGEVTINGKKYKNAASNFFNEKGADYKLGQAGTFYIDAAGKLAAFQPGSGEGSFQYGYLIAFDADSGLGESISFKLLTYDGNIITTDRMEKIKLNGKSVKGSLAAKQLEESARLINPDFKMSQLVKYKIDEEGRLRELQTVLADYSGAEEDHLRLSVKKDTYSVDDDTNGRIYTKERGSYGSYFRPLKYFTVPDIENMDDKNYSVDRKSTSFRNIDLELYDTDIDLVPSVALEYISAGSDTANLVVTTNISAPVMVNDVLTTLDEDGIPVSAVEVATGVTTKTYIGEDEHTFDGLKTGDLIMLYTRGRDIISSWLPVKFDGEDIRADSLPSLDTETVSNTIDGVSYPLMYGQVYYAGTGGNFVIDSGPLNSATGRRKNTYTCNITTNINWQMGGVIVYDAVNGREPVARNGSVSDLKSVYKDGAENAARVFWLVAHGSGRQIILYLK